MILLEILNKLNQSVDPCEDFYEYSCGGFLEKTHLKDDQPQLGSFTVAFDAIQKALKEILQDEALWSSSSWVRWFTIIIFIYTAIAKATW